MAEARAAAAGEPRPASAAGACAGPVPRSRPGRREASLELGAEPSSVLELERFVEGLGFLAARERDRMKLAGDEILDNLVKHAAPIEGGRILARAARRGDGIFLGFYFRSARFADFASSCGDPEPLFDPEWRRWRGIGLRMCRNLCRGICMRSGGRHDRILLRFDPEPAGSRGQPELG